MWEIVFRLLMNAVEEDCIGYFTRNIFNQQRLPDLTDFVINYAPPPPSSTTSTSKPLCVKEFGNICSSVALS